MVFARKYAPFRIDSLDDLKGKRVAHMKAVKFLENILARYGNEVTAIESVSILSALTQVMEGRADVVLGMNFDTYLLHQSLLTGIEPVYIDSTHWIKASTAVRSDWSVLVDILNKGLAAIGDAEISQIIQKWTQIEPPVQKCVPVTYEQPIDYGLFWKIGAGGVFFVCLFFFWNRRLATEVKKRTKDLASKCEALKKSETQYRTLFNSAGDGIAIMKGDLFIDCNPKFAELFGCPTDQIVGRSPAQFSPPIQPDGRESNEKAIDKINRAMLGEPQFFKWQHKKVDGTLYDAEITLACVEIGSERYILAINRDVTARNQAEMERKSLKEQLQQAQKMEAIGTLAGGIAHDFNNILSAIFGYTKLAQDHAENSETLQKYHDGIFKGALRARDLVAQILAFSRKSDQELRPLKAQLIIKEAIKLLRSSIPATIEIKQNINTDCKAILADPTTIHQIVMNLCTNAYHAMRESGGILEISLQPVEISSAILRQKVNLGTGDCVKLEVSDTGTGISKKDQERIFEPYFTTKAKGEGTGLGLSVVHGIVQSIGGEINFYSELGKGTTFCVYFPVIEEAKTGAIKAYTSPVPTGQENILLVDDDEDIVQVHKMILETLGYTVSGFSNSRIALEMFQKNPDFFDLVITDMTMPDMTGADLTRRILAIRPDLPIILCTGFSELINAEKAKEMGIRDYVMKPVIKNNLAITIRKILDSSH